MTETQAPQLLNQHNQKKLFDESHIKFAFEHFKQAYPDEEEARLPPTPLLVQSTHFPAHV